MAQDTFSTPGEHTWDVPGGVSEITIECWGPGAGTGGDTNTATGGDGGDGGYIEAEQSVSGGDTLTIYVGGAGGDGGDGGDVDGAGGGGDSQGWFAGGDGGAGSTFIHGGGGGGGGSASAVLDPSDALIATGEAGGGGGGAGAEGGDNTAGGGGGGARGGVGGAGINNGGDATGTGTGGDGGDGGEESVNGTNGAHGDTDSGAGATVLTATSGGGNAGDGEVALTYVIEPTAPDSASQTVQDDTTIDVSWGSGDNVDTYHLQVSEDGSAFATVDDTIPSGTTSYEYTATATVNEHQFRVRGENADGESDWTLTDTVATDAAGLTVAATRDAEIDLTWDAPRDADGHHVYRAEATGSTQGDYTEVADVGTAGSHTDTGLENGERYYYRVAAYYSGAESQLSNEADGTTTVPAPTGLTVTATTEDELDLTWTKNDNSPDGNWEILRSTDGSTGSVVGAIMDPSVTSFTDVDLADGEEHHYTVRRNTDHASVDSSQVAEVTILPAPTDLVVDATTTDTADLSWTNTHDNGTVTVQYRRSSESTWQDAATDLDRSTESYQLTGLLNGEEYDVRVLAVTEHTQTEDS